MTSSGLQSTQLLLAIPFLVYKKEKKERKRKEKKRKEGKDECSKCCGDRLFKRSEPQQCPREHHYRHAHAHAHICARAHAHARARTNMYFKVAVISTYMRGTSFSTSRMLRGTQATTRGPWRINHTNSRKCSQHHLCAKTGIASAWACPASCVEQHSLESIWTTCVQNCATNANNAFHSPHLFKGQRTLYIIIFKR